MFRYLFPLILLLMVGCSSKVDTDYDPAYQTALLKTFAIVENVKGADTLDDERIREAITREMEQKGYTAVSQDAADFHISFLSRFEKDVPSNVSFGFGVGTFSSGVGGSVGTTRNVTNDKETLLINMVDPKTQKIFWRSEVSKKRRDFKSPQARSDYFNKLVASLVKEFPARTARE
jgi:hypothetical protein